MSLSMSQSRSRIRSSRSCSGCCTRSSWTSSRVDVETLPLFTLEDFAELGVIEVEQVNRIRTQLGFPSLEPEPESEPEPVAPEQVNGCDEDEVISWLATAGLSDADLDGHL